VRPKDSSKLWPKLVLGAGLVVLGLSAAIALQTYVERKHRADCQSNLVFLGVCLHFYADARDVNGELPAKLSDVYPDYLPRYELLSCPARPYKGHPPQSVEDVRVGDHRLEVAPVATWPSNKFVGYEYLPGRWLSIPTPSKVILAFDKAGNHPGGFNVLYMDLHVEWWPNSRRAEFDRLLAEQEAMLPTLKASRVPSEPAQ
jgi:prepilin-type processing-associated H-X9-DG protein